VLDYNKDMEVNSSHAIEKLLKIIESFDFHVIITQLFEQTLQMEKFM